MNEKTMEIRSRIAGLKQLLAASDYKALKYAEGQITDEDYETVRADRQALRDKINELEAELEAAEGTEA